MLRQVSPTRFTNAGGVGRRSHGKNYRNGRREYVMTNLTFHPLANVFPLLEGEEFDALVADIKASGLCEAIWLYENQVLDGRNRFRACQVLGYDCPTRDYLGHDPVGFIISLNLRRRHLAESQRAMVGARLATLPRGANQHAEISAPTQQDAATLLHVSADSIQAARKVQHEGAAEVIAAVDAGAIAVSAALPLMTLPREVQPLALEEATREAGGKKPTARQTRAVVSRKQVVAAVEAELEAGKTAEDAVATALQRHAITPLTPDLADAVAHATGGQIMLDVVDGVLHDGCTKVEEAAVMAETWPMSQLLNALEALATLPDLEPLLSAIPVASAYRVAQYVAQYLAPALSTLTRFDTLWKAHQDAEACHLQGQQEQPSLVPEVSAELQQPSQPAQAPSRGETGPEQRREETEDATKQTEKPGVDYDTTKFYLGKLCLRAHTYRDTGQTLRRKSKRDCVQCNRGSYRS